jgi:ribosomal protein L11 methylase PrmA
VKCAQWLILSGILREQQGKVIDALDRNEIAVVEMRRRGKWVAILATRTILSSRAQAGGLTNTR